MAQLVEPRHVNPEVAGSSPALVNFSLFIQIYLKICTQSVSLVVYYMTFYLVDVVEDRFHHGCVHHVRVY